MGQKFLILLTALSFHVGLPTFSHPHVAPVVEGGKLPFEVCLEVQLNGFDMTVAVGGRAVSNLNTTGIAESLLSMADSRGGTNLARDSTALVSMAGWAENRIASKVLIRLDLRQRLRRSATAPRLLLSSGSCKRAWAQDVLTAVFPVPKPTRPPSPPTRGGGKRAHSEEGDHDHDHDEEEEEEEEEPWVVADYSSLNGHSRKDWAWVLGGRSSLAHLAVPLVTLLELSRDSLPPWQSPPNCSSASLPCDAMTDSHVDDTGGGHQDGGGDKGGGKLSGSDSFARPDLAAEEAFSDAVSEAARQRRERYLKPLLWRPALPPSPPPPSSDTVLRRLKPPGLLRAVAAVLEAASSHLLPGASMSFALPYCHSSSDSGSRDHDDDDAVWRRRVLCDSVNRLLSNRFPLCKATVSHYFHETSTTASSNSSSSSSSKGGHGNEYGVNERIVRVSDESENENDDDGSSSSSGSGGGRIRSGKHWSSSQWTPGAAALASLGGSESIGGLAARAAAAAAAAATKHSKREEREGGASTDHNDGDDASWSEASWSDEDSWPERWSVLEAAFEPPPAARPATAAASPVAGTLVINLARRPDRWLKLQDSLAKLFNDSSSSNSSSASTQNEVNLKQQQQQQQHAQGQGWLRGERLEAVDGTALLTSGVSSTAATGKVGKAGRSNSSSQDEAGDDDEADDEIDAWWESRTAVAKLFGTRGGRRRRHGRRRDMSATSSSFSSSSVAATLNPHPDHGWRPSVIGCALSHLKAWRRIARTAYPCIEHELGLAVSAAAKSRKRREKEHRQRGRPLLQKRGKQRRQPTDLAAAAAAAAAAPPADTTAGTTTKSGVGNCSRGQDVGSVYASWLVLEDDVELSRDFALRFEQTMDLANRHFGWDVLFLGALDDRDFYGDAFAAWSCVHDDAIRKGVSKTTRRRRPKCLVKDLSSSGRVFGSGLFGYVLRPRAARALLLAAVHKRSPLSQPVDWWVWEKLAQRPLLPTRSESGGGDSSGGGSGGGSSGDASTRLDDARHLHRLAGLKAWPPLASSPEGEGRDSDNDETFAGMRFATQAFHPPSSGGGGGAGGRVLLSVTYPPPPSAGPSAAEPFHLTLATAERGDALVYVEVGLARQPNDYPAASRGGKQHEKKEEEEEEEEEKERKLAQAHNFFLEQHKLDFMCVQVWKKRKRRRRGVCGKGGQETYDVGGDGVGGAAAANLDGEEWEERVAASEGATTCLTMGDGALRLPPSPFVQGGAGEYRVRAALVAAFPTDDDDDDNDDDDDDDDDDEDDDDEDDDDEEEEEEDGSGKEKEKRGVSDDSSDSEGSMEGKKGGDRSCRGVGAVGGGSVVAGGKAGRSLAAAANSLGLGRVLERSAAVSFAVVGADSEERVELEVTVDGAVSVLSWKPSETKAYDFARHFCVFELNLREVAQAGRCVAGVLDSLHTRRRQGRGLTGP